MACAYLTALPLLCCIALQDAVRGEFREVAKLLSDNGGRIYEDGGLVRGHQLPVCCR